MKIISNLFICFALVIGFSVVSFAGVPVDPTITKSLNEGPLAVGSGKDETTIYKFTIEIDGDYDSEGVVTDVLPAEFDAAGTCTEGDVDACCSADADCDVAGVCDPGADADGECTAGNTGLGACTVDADCDLAGTCGGSAAMASCGSVTIEEKNKPGDKLRPDHVEWDLDGCDGPETLMICMNTDLNPGHAKRGIDFYEPTSCGPLVLNDGASFDEITFSDSLIVAACETDDETSIDCVDADADGWSVDCNDCDDADPAVNPDAVEVCDDATDNDCDGLVDCDDPDCVADVACTI